MANLKSFILSDLKVTEIEVVLEFYNERVCWINIKSEEKVQKVDYRGQPVGSLSQKGIRNKFECGPVHRRRRRRAARRDHFRFTLYIFFLAPNERLFLEVFLFGFVIAFIWFSIIKGKRPSRDVIRGNLYGLSIAMNEKEKVLNI